MQEQNLPQTTTPESGNTPAVESAPSVSGYEQSPSPVIKPEMMPAPGDSVKQAGPAPQYAPVNLPQPIGPQDATPVSSSSNDSSSPTVADDVDVIEKVWVDKAKTIVKQTKDDPYAQEKQVSNLQEDYQQKRYGQDKPNR